MTLLLRGLPNSGWSPLLAFRYQQQSASPESCTSKHETLAVAVADPRSAHAAGWLCALRHTIMGCAAASPLLTTAQPSPQVSTHALLSPSIPFPLSASHNNQQCADPRLGALPGHRRTRSASPSLGSLHYSCAAQPAALWSSGAHESHRSVAPVRPATAQASRTIKHRASSLVAAPALHSFGTEGGCCRLCDLQGMQGVSRDPLHRTGQGCCKDCGYLSNSTEQDSTFILPSYRPPASAAAALASSGGCLNLWQTEGASSAAGLGLSTVPVVPSSFLDHLACRKPSHCVSGSHDQMPDALLTGMQQSHSIAAHYVASGNQKLLSNVPDAVSVKDSKAAFGHCLQNSPVSEQHHIQIMHQQQQAEQQQQLGSDVRGSSPTAASDGRQLALSSAACQAEAVSPMAAQLITADTLQVQQQGIAAAVEQRVQPVKQQEQQPGLTQRGSSCSAAGHRSDRDWQLPQSISDQLQQARLSVTAIPRLTSSQPRHSLAAPAVAETPTASTAAVEAPLLATQTATLAAAHQLLVPTSGLAASARQAGQGQALEGASGKAWPQAQPRQTESLAQLRAVVAEGHHGTRPQPPAQTDGQLYPGLCSQTLPSASSHSRTAKTMGLKLPDLQSPSVMPVKSMSTDATSVTADPHAPSSSTPAPSDAANKEQHGDLSNLVQASSVRYKSYDGHCSSSIQSSQMQTHIARPASAASHRQTSWPRGCVQTQSRLLNTCDEATEMFTCMSMSPEDRRILAQRFGMEHDEADWVLGEAYSSGSGSEGSVSSESNLRPSSVGRCRVISGRHSKVVVHSI